MNSLVVPNIHKPAHITSLATSSILVDVPVRVWTATKRDKQSSRELTDAKGADPTAADVTQHLLADNPRLKLVKNYRQHIYNWKQRRTYPWAGSLGLLPVIDLPKFMSEFQEHQREFNKLVDDFFGPNDDAYNQDISNMAFKAGKFFNKNNYPPADLARHYFGIDVFTSNVPEGDYRCAIAVEAAEDVYLNTARQYEKYIGEMADTQVNQLSEVMESLSKCCTVETSVGDDGKVKVSKGKIYDSTIEKAIRYCEVFEQFNVTGNPKLEEARSRLAKVLQGMSVGALRESDHLRITVKNEVDDILSKFR